MMRRVFTIGLFLIAGVDALAQVPTITSFTPTSGPVGTAVTITGINFNTINNIVHFGAVEASVTTLSDTQLSVTVPAGATHEPITVLDFATGRQGSSDVPFIITFPGAGPMTTSSFGTAVDFFTGGDPGKAVMADFDGDGQTDVAVSNVSANNVSVFRNTATAGTIVSGSFSSKVDFVAGGSAYPIAAGDVDGDGKIDMVVANGGTNTVSVFRNTASIGLITSGSFSTKVDFPTGGNPTAILIEDADGDGRPELIVSNYNDNTVSVLRNTSTQGNLNLSSFASRVDFVTSSGPIGLAFSDLDGDGKKDLLVANGSSNSVSVLRNTATPGTINSGSFATRIDFGTALGPESVCVGDMDSDGKEDVVVANASSNSVSVLRNTHIAGAVSASSLATKVDFVTGTFQSEVRVSDVNGDGKLDIVVDNGSSNVSVLRNASSAGVINSASFASKIDFTIGANLSGVVVGDVDGDGKPDFVGVNNTGSLSVLHNKVLAPEPTAQPTSMTFFQIISTAFRGSWTEPVPQPDGYLAVMSGNMAPDFVPVDGISYNINDQVGLVSGNIMYVVQNSSVPGINLSNLTPNEPINIKVYAFNGSGPTTNYLTSISPLSGQQAATPDLVKPEVTNATPTTVAPDASLVFRANFTDDGSGIDYAEVEYRPITALASTNFELLEMFPTTGSTFEIDLPANQVGELGVEFRFLGTDFEGNTNATTQQTFRTRVRHENGLVIPYTQPGRTVAAYRIIAVPLILDDKSLNTVMGRPYDPTLYAAYYWNGSGLEELNDETQLQIGMGYWFISGISIDPGIFTGPGLTPDVAPSNPFQITLTPGWNQIGNPYNFNISWNDILLANPTKVADLGGTDSKIRVFRSTADNVDELVTFEGGFVKNTSTSNVTIDIPVAKNPTINSRKAIAGPLRNTIDQPSWEIIFNLSQGDLAYNLGGLGMRPDADVEYDTFDDFNLPRFFEYLEVKFPKERVGMTYTKDIVPTAANFVWPFTVDSNIGEGPITIGWDNSYFGSGKEIFLLDLSEHRAINMGEVEKYTFSPSPSRPFEVVYGDAEFVKNEILPDQPVLFAPYPNPFSERVTLGYSLPKDAAIHGAQLDIYNNQGARVSAAELSAEPGEGSWEWVSEQAPGMYFVRLRVGDHLVMRKLIKR